MAVAVAIVDVVVAVVVIVGVVASEFGAGVVVVIEVPNAIK